MIRGLILLGLASQAYGLTTATEGVKLYLYTTSAACILAKDTAGTAHSATNFVSSKYWPLGECIETAAGGKMYNFGAPTGTSNTGGAKALEGYGVFNIGTDASSGVTGGVGTKGVAADGETMKWIKADGTLVYYTNAACATASGTTVTAWTAADTAQTGNGVCVTGQNALSFWNFGPAGVTMLAKAGASLATTKWVTIQHYANDTAQDCAVTATAVTAGGIEMFPVATADTATAKALACSQPGANDSHVFVCNAGVIEYHVHTGNKLCTGTGTAVRKLLMPSTATGLCYNQSSTAAADAGTGIVHATLTAKSKDSWKITNSAAEYATICPTPVAASGGAIASAVGAGLAAAALIL